jgi:hypothetical protein
MDKKIVVEVHKGEDYVSFKVNGKEREWTGENGDKMLKLLNQFLKGLV